MKVLIAGCCGFVGSSLIRWIHEHKPAWKLLGIDNLSRDGSEQNRSVLSQMGGAFFFGDIRNASDLSRLPEYDWVIDCAALPSVLGGVPRQVLAENDSARSDLNETSRQVVESNLLGKIQLLESCAERGSGLVMISSSRVYSIGALLDLKYRVEKDAFVLDEPPTGNSREVSLAGVREGFSVTPPLSFYGSCKLASEMMAMEYASAYRFPLRINRCGLIAGEGQFGRADQGVVTYWIRQRKAKRPLRFIGFGGQGHQVRDVLHPIDLAQLATQQIEVGEDSTKPVVANVSGGIESAFSLRQLNSWCDEKSGQTSEVDCVAENRPYDLPWLILDSTLAAKAWGFQPKILRESIFDRIWREG